MNTKIRLVGGPFGGKMIDHPRPGAHEFKLAGPKKMSRKARFDWDNEQMLRGVMNFQTRLYPRVEARYRICRHPDSFSEYNLILAKHPDGSIFYEYVEGSRYEY